MFRATASDRSLTATRRSPGKGDALASPDRLPQQAPRARRPAVSVASAHNTSRIGHIPKFESFIFSSLRTLFPAPNPQPAPFHAHAHSFTHNKKVTPAFPITSTLFARSLSPERKLTSSFSTACALFCRNEGVRVADYGYPKISPARKPGRASVVAIAWVARPPYLVAQNKGPADRIDTNTSCAVSFRDR
jgi:hypothetical protein